MKRREFLKGSALATGAVALSPGLLRASARPNVLLIEVDQMRYPRWWPEGLPKNMARIADSGVSFTRHFTSAVACSPSRACLFTGTYTTQNRMLTNCDFVEGKIQPSLDPKIPTLGHLFRKAGFRTPYRGKWHLTRKADRNKDDALLDYGWEGWKPPEAPFGGPPYNGQLVDPVYAGRAIDWLGNPENHKQPWFLVCSLINPHDITAYPRYYPHERIEPIKCPSPAGNWKDDLAGKPGVHKEFQRRYVTVAGKLDLQNPDAMRRYLDYYAECQEMVDKQAGRVLDALEKSGQAQNTIVVFTSDHGDMCGSHSLRTKGNFAYEEVMNVPLIFVWPGRIGAGLVTESLASNVDVMPTLLALAGVSNGNYMAGKDLSPVLRDPKAEVREDVLYHCDYEVAFRVGKSEDENSIYDNPSHVRSLREKDWKYAYYFSPGRSGTEEELYNLKDDPLEMTNLASDAGYRKKLEEMRDRLREQEQKLAKEFKA